MSGCPLVFFAGPFRYPAAAAIWRAVNVSAAVPVAAAARRAPAAAAEELVAATVAATAASVRPSFGVLFECAPFLCLC